jgi:hypothetical protein
MSVAALIADMVRAGVDPDLIGRTADLLASRDAAVVKDEAAERRREADRERKRAGRLRNSAESADNPSLNVSEGFPEPLPNLLNPIPKKTPKGVQKRVSDPSGELINLGCSEALIADWLAVRKAKRGGPITATAIDGLRREAEKAGLSVSDAVRCSVENSWIGFKAEWWRNLHGRNAAPMPRAGPVHAPPRRGSAALLDALHDLETSHEAPNDFSEPVRPLLGFSERR